MSQGQATMRLQCNEAEVVQNSCTEVSAEGEVHTRSVAEPTAGRVVKFSS